MKWRVNVCKQATILVQSNQLITISMTDSKFETVKCAAKMAGKRLQAGYKPRSIKPADNYLHDRF